jgi:hypothetical protein
MYNNNNNMIKAIKSLCPDAKFILKNGIIDMWSSIYSIPTEEEIQIKMQELEFDYNKQNKKQQVENQYQKAIQQDIEYNGNMFQADKDSQDILTKVITSSTEGFEIDWLDANNTLVHMTLDDLKGLANAILLRGQEEFIKKVALKKQIENCSTVEELETIVIGDANE